MGPVVARETGEIIDIRRVRTQRCFAFLRGGEVIKPALQKLTICLTPLVMAVVA